MPYDSGIIAEANWVTKLGPRRPRTNYMPLQRDPEQMVPIIERLRH